MMARVTMNRRALQEALDSLAAEDAAVAVEVRTSDQQELTATVRLETNRTDGWEAAAKP